MLLLITLQVQTVCASIHKPLQNNDPRLNISLNRKYTFAPAVVLAAEQVASMPIRHCLSPTNSRLHRLIERFLCDV